MNDLLTTETLLMITPLVILQLSLAIYCLFNIRREGVANLSPGLWIFIVLFPSMIGPIAYLIIGRPKHDYD